MFLGTLLLVWMAAQPLAVVVGRALAVADQMDEPFEEEAWSAAGFPC